MSEQDHKIKAALSGIEPSADAKERMYANILQKAAAEKAKAKKMPTAKILRYALPIAACLCIAVIGILRFIPGTPEMTEPPFVQGTSPVEDVENAAAFAPLGVSIDAPADADDVTYAIISGETACVTFRMGDHTYRFCASAKTGEVANVYGETLSAYTVDAASGTVLTRMQGFDGVYIKIEWTKDGVAYALTNTDGTDADAAVAVFRAVCGG